MEKQLYVYKAYVTKVYDGDTCTVDIDLGLKTWIRDEKIRLYEIDAPELYLEEREQGLKSRDYLKSLILDKEIILQTIKDRKGKYGRYLGIIWVQDENGTIINVNEKMVASGYAVFQEY